MSDPRVRRIAQQEVETAQLMGVDFVPVRRTPGSALEGKPSAVQESDVARPGDSSASPAKAPDAGSRDEKQAALDALRERHAAECVLCQNMPGATQIVFGEGDPDAAIMFIGEGPGEEEDRTGRPFVGRAGQKLDEMIKAMGLSREQVYIANIVKIRPPNNRTPTTDEMDTCGPFLAEQVRIIRPQAMVALGNAAVKYLLGTSTGITRLRGNWAEYVVDDLAIPLMPTFHPAYVLRNYTVETRKQVWSDLQAVLKRVGS